MPTLKAALWAGRLVWAGLSCHLPGGQPGAELGVGSQQLPPFLFYLCTPFSLWLGQGLPGFAPHHQRTACTLSSRHSSSLSPRATSELRSRSQTAGPQRAPSLQPAEQVFSDIRLALELKAAATKGRQEGVLGRILGVQISLPLSVTRIFLFLLNYFFFLWELMELVNNQIIIFKKADLIRGTQLFAQLYVTAKVCMF